MFETIAIIFLIFLIGLIFYGYSIIMRKSPSQEDLQTEKCSICQQRFPKENLIERQVGDSKLLYFCHRCIADLEEDAKKQVVTTRPEAGPLFSDASEKHRTN